MQAGAFKVYLIYYHNTHTYYIFMDIYIHDTLYIIISDIIIIDIHIYLHLVLCFLEERAPGHIHIMYV